MKRVTIFTDGSCNGNPGAGGFAAILVCDNREKIISGRSLKTTNNRMEMQAVIEGLNALKKACDVMVCTDSAYIVNNFNRIPEWRANGWRGTRGAIKNHDLWQAMDAAWRRAEGMQISITFCKVTAHTGIELNERCDKLAKQEAMSALYDDV